MPQKQISTEFQPTMPSTDNIPTASTNKLKAWYMAKDQQDGGNFCIGCMHFVLLWDSMIYVFF